MPTSMAAENSMLKGFHSSTFNLDTLVPRPTAAMAVERRNMEVELLISIKAVHVSGSRNPNGFDPRSPIDRKAARAMKPIRKVGIHWLHLSQGTGTLADETTAWRL